MGKHSASRQIRPKNRLQFRHVPFPVAIRLTIAAIAAGIIIFGLIADEFRSPAKAASREDNANVAFVGSGVCAECHEAQAKDWKSSHHALAMQAADNATVLGDFNEAVATHFNSKARFYRKEGGFFVETEGKDGETAEFQIKYTFGVSPLQQYLIALSDGRV